MFSYIFFLLLHGLKFYCYLYFNFSSETVSKQKSIVHFIIFGFLSQFYSFFKYYCLPSFSSDELHESFHLIASLIDKNIKLLNTANGTTCHIIFTSFSINLIVKLIRYLKWQLGICVIVCVNWYLKMCRVQTVDGRVDWFAIML